MYVSVSGQSVLSEVLLFNSATHAIHDSIYMVELETLKVAFNHLEH